MLRVVVLAVAAWDLEQVDSSDCSHMSALNASLWKVLKGTNWSNNYFFCLFPLILFKRTTQWNRTAINLRTYLWATLSASHSESANATWHLTNCFHLRVITSSNVLPVHSSGTQRSGTPVSLVTCFTLTIEQKNTKLHQWRAALMR